MSDETTICVYCGSSLGSDPDFESAAADLGAAIADAGHRLTYGGGHVGLMGAIADAALAAGGEVVGFIPQSLADREIAHTSLTELHVTDSMHSRKAAMASLADGFVVLPGGFGTLDEVMEVLTWNQIGSIDKPVAFYDIAGYYTKLFEFLDHAVTAGMLNPTHRSLARRADTAAEAVAIAAGPGAGYSSKW